MKHKLSRGEKRLITSLVLAFAILGGGYGWRNYLDREPVVNIPPYPKMPNPNGFDLYVKAAQTIVPATPPVDEISDANPPKDPKIRAQQYSLQRKEAWLKQNEKAFQLFQQALRTPTLHPESRSSDSMFSSYTVLRELARAKRIESKAFQLRDDWNSAMQSRLDVVQMGNDVTRGGLLITALVSMAIQAIGRDTPWPVIEKLNAEQCRAAIVRLEKIYEDRILPADILTEEKYFGQNETLKTFREPNWRVFKNDEMDLMEDETISLSTRWRALTVSKRMVMDNYSHYMDAVIANAKLPYAAKKKPLPSLNDPFSSRIGGIYENAQFNFARNDAGNALWLIALALRAYKLENGQYPMLLKELAPKYLKEIPGDPFGAGESLRYKNQGSAYLLYSIGPDGVDNGGTPIPHDNRFPLDAKSNLPSVNPESKGDYVAGKNR